MTLSEQQFGMTTRFTDHGERGNRTHITREDTGMLPIESVINMRGAMGEQPGEHRNKQGKDWDEFKADVATGIRNPLFITVDYGEAPKLSEGNHRRDAAAELGHTHVPATVRYFGKAEEQGVVGEKRYR